MTASCGGWKKEDERRKMWGVKSKRRRTQTMTRQRGKKSGNRQKMRKLKHRKRQ